VDIALLSAPDSLPLPQARALRLSGGGLADPAGMEAPLLSELVLVDMRVSDQSLASLVAGCPVLHTLALEVVDVVPVAATPAAFTPPASLRRLCLTGLIGAAAVAALALCGRQLAELELRRCNVPVSETLLPTAAPHDPATRASALNVRSDAVDQIVVTLPPTLERLVVHSCLGLELRFPEAPLEHFRDVRLINNESLLLCVLSCCELWWAILVNAVRRTAMLCSRLPSATCRRVRRCRP
jgi:hypothetical protein